MYARESIKQFGRRHLLRGHAEISLSRTHAIIIIASNQPFPANIAWQDEIFCPHGGLSPSIDSLDDIATLDR